MNYQTKGRKLSQRPNSVPDPSLLGPGTAAVPQVSCTHQTCPHLSTSQLSLQPDPVGPAVSCDGRLHCLPSLSFWFSDSLALWPGEQDTLRDAKWTHRGPASQWAWERGSGNFLHAHCKSEDSFDTWAGGVAMVPWNRVGSEEALLCLNISIILNWDLQLIETGRALRSLSWFWECKL